MTNLYHVTVLGAGWDVDEELDIPVEAAPQAEGKQESGYFAPPPRGTSMAQTWTAHSQLAVDHVLAGSFETACRLLHDQIGVVSFDPLKETMLSLMRLSRTSFQPQPLGPSMVSYPLRNWQEGTPKNFAPAMVLQLTDLVQRLQSCYQLTTAGKFQEAVDKLRQIMWNIPFLVVPSKQEQVEASQLLEICREYVLGISMELVRKELAKSEKPEDRKRSCEVKYHNTRKTFRTERRIYVEIIYRRSKTN